LPVLEQSFALRTGLWVVMGEINVNKKILGLLPQPTHPLQFNSVQFSVNTGKGLLSPKWYDRQLEKF
jgi:hypothetical protein